MNNLRLRRNDWVLIAVGIALLVAACMIIAFLIVPILFPQIGSKPASPTLTASNWATPPVAVTCDARWDQIRANGVLVVGTSADYPPFEYYNPQFQVDGFDPQLMTRIGQVLGLQVVFKDFAFEGLTSALSIGQIDAAISAISMTPERQGIVDFSDVYYYGMDAVLAQANSSIQTISSVNQMAAYRVGVQTGTVYANTLQNGMVATGIMPAANLMQYPRIDGAIADLQAGRLDIVWLDQQPAAEYVQAGGVKLVAQGLNPQSYAIAMCKGATRMRNEINRAISQLSSQGVIGELTVQYLNLQNPVTPPTQTPLPPGPTATPAPPPPCVDSMSYVADLNYPDNNMKNPPVLAPGQPFTKGWRIRNSGTCPWTSTYYLGFAGGNVPSAQMGGQDTYIQGVVQPGATYDMYVNLVAPIVPGTYQGFWQMYSSIRYPFGQKVWVGIQVAPVATVTPQPSQTASPNINFSANPTSINQGGASTFTWSVQGAQAVYFYAQGQSWQNFPVPPQSSQVVYPAQTTTYELRVTFTNGATEVRQITILVNQPPPPVPVINSFVVNPNQVQVGGCVAITWSVAGGASKVQVWRNQDVILDGAQLTGSAQDCLNNAGQVIYKLVASNTVGVSVSQEASVNVSAPPTTAPPPTTGLVGPNWLLTNYLGTDGTMQQVLTQSHTSLTFFDNGTISGVGGCNNYSGPYQVNGLQLMFGSLTVTNMTCDNPPGIMDQEAQYFSLLTSVTRYEIASNQLNLYNQGGTPVLQYVVAVSPR